MLEKCLIFSKVAGCKNEFTFAKSLSNLVYDFWENYFRKTANRLIYLNVSIGI